MGIPQYLAMTAGELSKFPAPEYCAYLACHFSAYRSGLSNLPSFLPPKALLLLDDASPICGHDPELVAGQLKALLSQWEAFGVLLDFQRPVSQEAQAMARYLLEALPCPTAVTASYALPGHPVFLAPGPLHQSLQAHLAPWEGWDIWLELAPSAQALTLTAQGCQEEGIPLPADISQAFREEGLHCHYRVEAGEEAALFTLWRSQEDLADLAQEAAALGVQLTVGLWQEMGTPE